MEKPQSSTVQMDLGNVPIRRVATINVFLSYASDAAKAARYFAERLEQVAFEQNLPVGFEIRHGWGSEGQGGRKTKAPARAPVVPAADEVLVAFLSPEYAEAPEREHVGQHLQARNERMQGFGVKCMDEGWERIPGVQALNVLKEMVAEQDLHSGAWRTRIEAAVEEFLDEVIHPALIASRPGRRLNEGAVPPSAPEHLFDPWDLSPGALSIVKRAAAETVEQGSGLALDTASVLAAMVTSGPPDGAPQWTGHWATRELAEAYGPLRERTRSGSGDRYPVDSDPPVSLGLGTGLDQAQVIAQKTSGAVTIHARHLLAAVLCDPRGTGSRALGILSDAGYEIAQLRLAFYDFVRGDTDDDEAWGRILLGEITEAPKLSKFDADDSHSEDFLDVRPDVLAFAGLIAARTLKPPLSIGLFGEWGSGKTFFMRMLRREIDRLAAEADATGEMQRDLPFYKRIIQIEFNAWHYVEGNLWASLVQHIFENLCFPGEKSPSRELQKRLMEQLKHENEAANQAERERKAAEKQAEAARNALEAARTKFDERAKELAALSRDNLLATLNVPEVRGAAEDVLRELGIDRLGDSAVQMRAALGEARVLLARGHAVASPLLHGAPQERRRRWFWLTLALLAGPATALVLGGIVSWFGSDGMAAITATTTGAAGTLAAGTAWLKKQMTTAGTWIEQVEAAQRQLDERIAKAQGENAQKIRAAEEALRLHEADYQAAQRKQEEAQRQVAAAEARLREASLAEALTTFVEDRANSDDYRKHLGTLALVRKDFERLSDLIEEENDRLDPPPSGSQGTAGLPRFETLKDEEPDRSRRVNRIVLYIDDLDRCPPAKVVEVLQAVHLLLAFPLFVVVVGVDARWVTRSLEARYRDLLGEKKDQRPGEFDELLGSASAHDYLEKIFQVPFWLRAMGEGASRRMVEGLLASSLVADGADAEEGQAEGGADGRPGAAETQPAIASGAGDTPVSHGAETGSAADGERMPSAAEEDEDPARETPDLSAESLEIRPEEIAFMRELAPLLGRSPRALKRFVNVYRLVKAGLSPYQRRVFTSPGTGMGDYRAVLFLLAVDTGAPRAAAPLLRVLQGSPPATLRDIVDQVKPAPSEAPDWRRVRDWLERPDGFALADDVAALARAARRVRRFSFHTGRVGDTDAPTSEDADPGTPSESDAELPASKPATARA